MRIFVSLLMPDTATQKIVMPGLVMVTNGCCDISEPEFEGSDLCGMLLIPKSYRTPTSPAHDFTLIRGQYRTVRLVVCSCK